VQRIRVAAYDLTSGALGPFRLKWVVYVVLSQSSGGRNSGRRKGTVWVPSSLAQGRYRCIELVTVFALCCKPGRLGGALRR